MVKELILSNPDTCLCTDEDGRTPLHLAMMRGRVNVLKQLYHARAEASNFIENNGDSILHLGLKHNHLEAIKLMLEMTRDHNLVNAKDREGNTILHLAAAYKQMETARYLLQRTGIEVNSTNVSNFTALDIMEYAQSDLKTIEIKELLLNTAAIKAYHIPNSSTRSARLINDNFAVVLEFEPVPPELDPNVAMAQPLIALSGELQKRKQKVNAHEKWLKKKKRDSLMVAATVMAAMAYQAGLDPPGGWDNDLKNGHCKKLLAGTSSKVANDPDTYANFWKYNSISLVASLSIVFLLVSGLPIRRRIII